MNLDHPRIIDVQNYRYIPFLLFYLLLKKKEAMFKFSLVSLFSVSSIFVATWNVAGRSPPNTLNLDDWLHSSSPADIYVLG